MARSKRKGLFDLIGSPFTLVPFVLGMGTAIVLWAVTERQERLALFMAIVGGLGSLGSLASLFVLNLPTTDHEQARKRREMMSGLEDLIAAVPEASTEGTAAAATALETT